MDKAARPLSPHLGYYRPQLTSVLSILNRITGSALSVGTIVLVYWLVATAGGPDSFGRAHDLLGSWIGLALLFAWSVALFYHLCAGIRHLVWDMGVGLDLKSVYATGYATLAATAILTIAAWAIGLFVMARA